MSQCPGDGPSTLHKKYSADQLTEWKPSTEVPESPGIYQLCQGKQLYDGAYDGTQWTMYQGTTPYRLNAFQLKAIKWRGLNFKPAPVEMIKKDFSRGWVFDWRDPGGPRPLTDRD